MKRASFLTGLVMLLPFAAAHADSGTTAAVDAAPTEASVQQLMDLTQSRELLDQIQKQVDESLEAGMKMGLGDAKLSPGQQKIMEDMRRKMSALLQEELSWERFQPMVVDIYRRTFSQAEVDGMLAFYRSDAGRAVIAKMPRAMQATMQSTQEMVARMHPKVQKIVTEMLEAIKADAAQQKQGATQ